MPTVAVGNARKATRLPAPLRPVPRKTDAGNSGNIAKGGGSGNTMMSGTPGGSGNSMGSGTP